MTDLVTNTNLIWAAKEAFKFPQAEQLETVGEILEWGINRDCLKYEKLREQLAEDLENLEAIEIDYTSLFVNSYPTAKAHPFAGWYFGEEIIFGNISRDLEQMYAAYGVIYNQDDNNLPADHILVELEFMAIMAEEYEGTGDSFYLEGLLVMLEQHMNDWVYEFLDQVETQADTAYFKALAITLKTFFRNLPQELKGVA